MNDKDDFWNLDRILPKKTVHKNNFSKVETVEIGTKNPTTANGVDIRTLFSAVNEKKGINTIESAIEKERDYTHFNKSRIMRYAYVGFYNSSLSYDSKARAYALNYFDRRPQRIVEHVDYYSIKPSFSDLNIAQLEYYIYWRDEIYHGNVIKASPSYAMLLVSEIINLPDKIEPQNGLDILITLWNKAFDDKSRIDKLFSDTVFEYCLVHNIPVPYQKLRDVINNARSPVSQILGTLYVIDYLLDSPQNLTESDLSFIFENCLSYSYKQGKHYALNEKFRNILDSSFYKVLSKFFKGFPECISKIFDNHEKRSSPIKIIKPAFLNINVSSAIKRNLVFEYFSFDKSDLEFQQLINIAKNLENRFRAECGIRARLAVSVLQPEFKIAIDKAVLEVLNNSACDSQEVDQRFTKKINININRAIIIEEQSWNTTKMLTEGIEVFEDEAIAESVEISDNSCELSEMEIAVLYDILNNDIQNAIIRCDRSGQFIDSIIASINEKVYDSFDDIIIDSNSKCVYDEFGSDITEMFFKEKK